MGLFDKPNYDPIPRPRRRIKDRAALAASGTALCELCKLKPGEHRHHHKPRSLGGDDHAFNLACLCHLCHRDVHAARIPKHAIARVIWMRQGQRAAGEMKCLSCRAPVAFTGRVMRCLRCHMDLGSPAGWMHEIYKWQEVQP